MVGTGQIGADVRGGVKTYVQNSVLPVFRYFLLNELQTDITLTAPVAINDTVLSLSAGHGFVGYLASPGERLTIFDNNRVLQIRVVLVNVNDVTIEYPSDYAFTTNATIIRGNESLNVDGSVTPVNFKMQLRNFTASLDVLQVILTLFHGTEGSDDLFGGLDELVNGLWFRKDNTIPYNLGNYKNMQDFKTVGCAVNYTAKGPSGYATDIRLEIKNIFNQVVRLNPNNGDIITAQVRDDLTDLTNFTVTILGHYAGV